MATGGTPLTRMFLVLVFAAVISALVFPVQAQDSEAADLLKQGLEQLRSGDPASVEAAISTLRKALAANPSSEEAMAALGRAEWRALINLMASGQEGANVAKAIMDIAQPILPEKAFDEAELKSLVQTAVTAKEYGDRYDAAVSLARVYGEFAVPHLIAYLASSNTDYKIYAHLTLTNHIGRDAVLPLNEALQSDNATVRFMVASELGIIGDERSLAAVSEALADEDDNVRGKAAEAWEKLGAKYPWAADMSASALYLRLARLYYAGDYRVLSFADRPLVLWSWGDGLASQPVPRHLYVLKLAEEAAYDALRIDPANGAARALLARIVASQRVAADMMQSMAEDELSQSYLAGLANAEGFVASMGYGTLTNALGNALDQHDQSAASFILGAMPHVYGGDDFTTDNAVVRATFDGAANVRMAAAAAVLRFNAVRRISAFPDPDGFINLVAAAVGEIIPRQILVVDGNDERRNKMLTELNNAKYIAYDARTGSDGILRATRFPGLDLILLSSSLVDMDVLAVLRHLSEDERTQNIPVVVVGTTEQAANEEWRNLYQDKVAGLTGIPAGPGLPTEEFIAAVQAAFGSEDPGAQARYARSAMILDALAGTDTGNALFNWYALSETLTGMLTSELPDEPPVRLNALRALGTIADMTTLAPLVQYFAGADDAGLQAAAGEAIASICRANEVALESEDFDVLLKGTLSPDEGVRNAAFAALGAAQLTEEQRAAVAMANRPGVGGGE